MDLFWLSFATEGRYLGAVIVEASDEVSAYLVVTALLGLNPGGEMVCLGPLPQEWVAPAMRNRLLTRKEVEALPPPPVSVVKLDAVRWKRKSIDDEIEARHE